MLYFGYQQPDAFLADRVTGAEVKQQQQQMKSTEQNVRTSVKRSWWAVRLLFDFRSVNFL
jgi:hypothetical protein